MIRRGLIESGLYCGGERGPTEGRDNRHAFSRRNTRKASEKPALESPDTRHGWQLTRHLPNSIDRTSTDRREGARFDQFRYCHVFMLLEGHPFFFAGLRAGELRPFPRGLG